MNSRCVPVRISIFRWTYSYASLAHSKCSHDPRAFVTLCPWMSLLQTAQYCDICACRTGHASGGTFSQVKGAVGSEVDIIITPHSSCSTTVGLPGRNTARASRPL